MREDIGITYETDILRLIDAFHSFGLYVGSVVVTSTLIINLLMISLKDLII